MLQALSLELAERYKTWIASGKPAGEFVTTLANEIKTKVERLKTTKDAGEKERLKLEIDVSCVMVARMRANQGTVLKFKVPMTAKPGDTVLVQLPDGRKAKIQIPATAKPGETLSLRVQQQAPAPTGGPIQPSKVPKGSESAASTPKLQNDNKDASTPPADESSKAVTSAPETPSKTKPKKKSKSKSKKRSRKRKSGGTTESPPSPFVNIAVGLGALTAFVVAGALFWSAAANGNTTSSSRRSSS